MSITRFRSYNPGEKPYSRRRTEGEWEPYHVMLSEMHAQRFTRREMLSQLREVGFDVSPGQLLSQMKKWNMTVYADRVSQSGICLHAAVEETTTVRPASAEPEDMNGSTIADTQMNVDVPSLPPLLNGHPNCGFLLSSDAERSDPNIDRASRPSPSARGEPPDYELPESEEAEGPPEYCPDTPSPAPHPECTSGSGAASSTSILRQIPTITEPWCGNFPTTCCCQALFRGQGQFASSPELHKIILEQSSPSSLKYVVALLNLVASKPAGQDRIDVRDHLWSAVDIYLQICTRVEYKNKLAPHILHRLLKVWEILSDDDNPPFPELEFIRSSSSQTHVSLLNKIFKTRPSKTLQAQTSDHPVDWQLDSERDVGCVVGFVARKPSTYPLLNSAGEVFGNIDSWNDTDVNDGSQRPLADLIPSANHIAAYMQAQWNSGVHLSTAYDLGDCNLPLIFTALGLMIALETSSSAHDPPPPSTRTHATKSWTPGLRTFIDTTINTLTLNADHADKFRKAYWLVRCEKIGHAGKTVHMGSPCTAASDWTTLERSIHEYDEERSWFERRLVSGRRDTWPKVDDLMAASAPNDAMSIMSEGSFDSFRRFRALALQLRIGMTRSESGRSWSLRTRNSGRRSSESHMSWELERILQIRDDVVVDDGENERTNSAQRAQIDQLAFERMQDIRE